MSDQDKEEKVKPLDEALKDVLNAFKKAKEDKKKEG